MRVRMRPFPPACALQRAHGIARTDAYAACLALAYSVLPIAPSGNCGVRVCIRVRAMRLGARLPRTAWHRAHAASAGRDGHSLACADHITCEAVQQTDGQRSASARDARTVRATLEDGF